MDEDFGFAVVDTDRQSEREKDVRMSCLARFYSLNNGYNLRGGGFLPVENKTLTLSADPLVLRNFN